MKLLIQGNNILKSPMLFAITYEEKNLDKGGQSTLISLATKVDVQSRLLHRNPAHQLISHKAEVTVYANGTSYPRSSQ